MDETSKELLPLKVEKLKPLLTDVLIKGFETFDS
jgi:hypothetical protein